MTIKRRGLSALALLAAGSLALAGCASGETTPGSTEKPAGGSAFITTNGSEPENPLIPTNTNEVGGGKILEQIFAGLFYYDAKGEPQKDMAESVESADSQNYTITIKADQTFSNGDKVTAKSFVDAWNYGAKAENNQNGQSWFQDIQGFDVNGNEDLSGLVVVDETTFEVHLTQPVSDFELRLGYSAYYPLPESAFADMKAFGEFPIGNGPYQIQDEKAWKHKERITLSKSESYAGARVAQNDGLEIVFYSTPEAGYTDLVSGNVDVLDQIPDSAMKTFQDELGDRAVNQASAISQTITIPERLEHFSGEEGKLRRQAISHAINREEITKVVFADTRAPAKDFTAPVIPGYSEDIAGSEVLTFDADKAKELWAQADAIAPWTGTFKIAYNSNGPHKSWVDAVSNQLKNNLGIDATGDAIADFSDMRKQITSQTIQTPFRSGWQSDYPGQYNFLGPLFGTEASANDGKYSNPAVDQLLNEGLAAASVDEGIEKFTQAQEILFQDLPAIPLWYQNAAGGYSENVDNVQFSWNSVPLYYEVTKK